MKKRYKVFGTFILIILVNSFVFLYIYLKNNVSVSLVLSGNKFTSNDEIFSKFEKRTDVFYWYLNKSNIRDQIRKLPFVKEVEIFPSSLEGFNKLNIAIKEENPFYLVKLNDDKIQVISDEGKMLSYLTNDKNMLVNWDFFNTLPVISGIDNGLDSSQTLNSRLIYIANFLKNIKTYIPYTINFMYFIPSGEVELKFLEIKPVVVLDLSKGDEWVDTELKRFNALVNKLGTQINNMSKIDLAYTKVGVLK